MLCLETDLCRKQYEVLEVGEVERFLDIKLSTRSQEGECIITTILAGKKDDGIFFSRGSA